MSLELQPIRLDGVPYYDGIKHLAKQTGKRVPDLLVLSQQNDPFYAGQPAGREVAEWFGNVWEKCGFTDGVHIRRIHYALVSGKEPTLLPNGELYANTDECWQFVQRASRAARYLGNVSPSAFDDRKNPPPVICLADGQPYLSQDVFGGRVGGSLNIPQELSLPCIKLHDDGYLPVNQHYHCEIWCEKTTMNDVLLPLCRQYGANLVTGSGELTLTAVDKLIARCRDDRPVRIFYVSDFDPAGQSMPVSIARKIEFFVRTERPDLDIKLFASVLTAEQCRQYNLPRIPIKDTEKRKAKFEETHGDGATELDALEAIHPGELRRILEGLLASYYDDTLRGRLNDYVRGIQRRQNALTQAVWEDHAQDVEPLKSEYAKLVAEFEALAEKQSRFNEMASEAMQAIELDLLLHAKTICLTDFPVAKERDDAEPVALYESSRDYFEQLDHYKMFKEGR